MAFAARTGDEIDPPDTDPAARRAEVAAAWAAVLEQRRLLGCAPAPAPWESGTPEMTVRAVALAIEAAGHPCSARDRTNRRTRTGYCVTYDPRRRAVQVRWTGPAGSTARGEARSRLESFGGQLPAAGWEGLVYLGPRNVSFLELTPTRAPH